MPAPRARSSTEMADSGLTASSRSAVARIASSRSSPEGAHAAPAAGGGGGLARGRVDMWRRLPTLQPSLNTVLTRSTRRRYGRSCTLPRQRRSPRRSAGQASSGARTCSTAPRPRPRPRRRPHRRRGALRHRRRLPPAGRVPGQELRDPRVARGDRRHLGPVPVSGDPLRLRHVHPRLRLPAVEGLEGDRRRPGDPPVHRGDRRRVRRPRQDPLPPPGALRRVVHRGRPLDGDRAAHRHRRDGAAHLLLAVGLLRLLPLRRGLPADLPGRGAVRRAADPPAALARGPRPDRQAGRRHRQRRHRRHPRAQPGRRRRARDHAAAHAELRPVAARPRPAGPGAAQQAPGDGGLSDRPVEERAAVHRLLPVQPPVPAGRAPAHPPAHAEAAAEHRRRHALQPAVQPVGPAAVPGARRRPVPHPAEGHGVDRRPTRSRRSPRRASSSSPASTSTPTSS